MIHIICVYIYTYGVYIHICVCIRNYNNYMYIYTYIYTRIFYKHPSNFFSHGDPSNDHHCSNQLDLGVSCPQQLPGQDQGKGHHRLLKDRRQVIISHLVVKLKESRKHHGFSKWRPVKRIHLESSALGTECLDVISANHLSSTWPLNLLVFWSRWLVAPCSFRFANHNSTWFPPGCSGNAQNLQGILKRQQCTQPSPRLPWDDCGCGFHFHIFGQPQKPESRQQRSNGCIKLCREKGIPLVWMIWWK